MMTDIIANNLCEMEKLILTNKRDGIWQLAGQLKENDAFEVFLISDITEEETDQKQALDKMLEQLAKNDVAGDKDIRVNIIIVSNLEYDERLKEHEDAYDYLWIISPEKKTIKCVENENFRGDNLRFVMTNMYTMRKTLIKKSVGKDWMTWELI